MLKNSARNSSPTCSLKRVRLDTDQSQLLMPSARSVGSTRDSFPKLNDPGAAKHAAFTTDVPYLTASRIEPAADLLHPATTSGRSVPAPNSVDKSFGATVVIANGNPLAKVVIPLTLHPDAILSATPATFDKNRLLRPSGKSRI